MVVVKEMDGFQTGLLNLVDTMLKSKKELKSIKLEEVYSFMEMGVTILIA